MPKIPSFFSTGIELRESFAARVIGWLSLMLVLIPFIGLSFYNAPQAEDFTVWVVSQAHTFPSAIEHWYFGFSGRYTSNSFVFIFEPLRHSVLPMAIILPLGQLFLLWYSVRTVFTKLIFNGNKHSVLLATGLSLYLYFHSLPSIFEGYYWTPGSMPYTLPLSLGLLNLCWLIEGNLNRWRKFLVLAFVFFIGGSSEITPIVYGLMMAGWVLYQWLRKKNPDRFFWIHFSLFILFTLLEVFAPGNFVRASLNPADGSIPVRDLGYSLGRAIGFLKGWGFTWLFRSPTLLIGGALFLLINATPSNNRSSKQLAYGITFILSAFATAFIPFFFFFVSVSAGLPDRVANIVYFCFIAALIGAMGLLAQLMQVDSNPSHQAGKATRLYALMFLFVGVLFSGMYPNKLYKSYEDLLTGRAKRYSQALDVREKMIHKSKSDTVIVPKLTDIPYSLYLIDICEDPKDWKNDGYAKYFGKKALIAR